MTEMDDVDDGNGRCGGRNWTVWWTVWWTEIDGVVDGNGRKCAFNNLDR